MFGDLYELAFPLTARFVSSMGGTFQDAKDIFQDALVIYHEKCSSPNFQLHSSAEAYLLGVSKHLWMRKHKQNSLLVPLNEGERQIGLPHDYFPEVNDRRLLAFLEASGQKCMQLLRAFYYEKLPMKQIASAFGYGSDRSATVQKFKCLEKVRDTIKEKAVSYEDFLN